jgi:hypothetical protein
MYADQKMLSRQLAIKEFAQSVGWVLFSRTDQNELKQCAVLMADIVTDSNDTPPPRSARTPIIGHVEDFAYLVGFYVIESLQHRNVSRRWMLHQFKRALRDRGMPDVQAEIQVTQFQAFYWNRMESLTWGAARRLSRKNLQKLLPSIYRLRKITGHTALFF